MKDSGIEWIGEIPESWDRQKIKHISSISSGEYISKEEYEDNGLYPIIGANGEIGRTNKRNNQELVVTTGRVGTIGTAHKVKDAWITDNVLIIGQIKVNVDFFRYSILNLDFQQMTSGTAMPLITASKIINQFIPKPPLKEQKAISAYLDRQCGLIDSVIEKTKASVEEYKKLRQAVITQALTKGVRGERAMKDSGIEWIGEIPEEWEITKLGRISSLRSGITLGRKIPDNAKKIERPYLRVANVQNGFVDTSTVTTLEVTEEEDTKYRLQKDDVLMTEGGDRDKLGRGCVWDGAIEPCLHQNHIFALRTNHKYLNQYFFAYVTASQIGRVYFDITAIKTTNLACTSSSKVMAFIIPLPSIEEQEEITAYLDQKAAEIDALITKKETFLTELESYKKSMIYEYVTGKKEVPQA